MKKFLPILCLFAISFGNPPACSYEIVIPLLSKKKNPKKDKGKSNDQKSNGLIRGDKQSMLKKAQSHLDKAKENLEVCQKYSYVIPNLGDQELFGELIGSFIVAIITPGTSLTSKMIITGLPLLSSLSKQSYQNYCNLRTRMLQAAADIESYEFYLEMATKLPISAPYSDQGTEYFGYAIDNLIMAEMHASIFTVEEYKNKSISQIQRTRNDIIAFVENPHYNAKIAQMIQMLSEGLSESSECLGRKDAEIFQSMNTYVTGAYDCAVIAQAIWGI